MRDAVQQIYALKSKMRSSRISWPGDESEESWTRAWLAIWKVWASKWNERAYVSCRKADLNHENLCMAVLIQEVICGDFAFVIHTKNPFVRGYLRDTCRDCEGLGRDFGGCISRTSYELPCQKKAI